MTPVPPEPVDLVEVQRVFAGGGDTFRGSSIRGHICAIVDSALHCWGANDRQQVSADVAEIINAPINVGLSSVTDASLGYRHTCAVYDEGRVTCFVVVRQIVRSG